MKLRLAMYSIAKESDEKEIQSIDAHKEDHENQQAYVDMRSCSFSKGDCSIGSV